jgi:hypothetical protein
MKFLSAAIFLLSALSTFAGIIGDTVLVSADEIQAGRAPLSCSLAAESDVTCKAKVSLKEPFGVPGIFEWIEYRIMPEKIEYSTFKAAVWDLKRIVRRGTTRSKSLEFQLSKDEIEKCLVLVTSRTGERNGVPVSRSAYMPLSALIAK